MPGPALLLHLPQELLVSVLGLLGARDLAAALSSCSSLSALGPHAWRAACFNRWPAWAAVAAGEAGPQWRRQYELLSLREAEAGCLPSPAAVLRLQRNVTERHRSILTEWLCEVSFDWELESTTVFKAVAYLDHYLERHAVEQLSRFQLLGLACLRAAMGDARTLRGAADALDKRLDPANFAYISDDTYSAEEVEAQTQVIAGLVPEALKRAPNPKMFLRSYWYRATARGVAHPDEMHIYTLASFLLQLALLDLQCSGHAPSLLAAAALSLSLAAYSKPDAWPPALQQFGSYLPADVAPVRARLAELQATAAAEQLRPIWRGLHEAHAYPEHDAEWKRLVLICSSASRAHLGAAAALPDCGGGGGAERAGSPALPQPQDATAMLVD